MNCYIIVDFGSTYTKLTLVDIDNECLKLTTKAHTTINDNIKRGYEEALNKLKKSVNFDDINIVETLACSSAAGGLKMVAIGITPTYTVEAAKRAALGAGARLLKTYSYFLNKESIEEISSLNPDIILLAGGAEGGNTSYIIHNAKMLTNLNEKIPIVVAGNSYANKNISEIFQKFKIEHKITDNVMPDVNTINPNPVREIIRKIFMEAIVKAKGMEDVQKITKELLMPTPTAVLKAAKLLSEGTEIYEGWGDIIVVDIGGATTDVHSISQPQKDFSLLQEGLAETFEKRSVEGDLGMRYSALSLYESVGENNFLKYKHNLKNIKEKCQKRYDRPNIIFNDNIELEFDEIMAKNCVDLSMKRHSGTIRQTYINGKNIFVQNGKDLRKIKIFVGTGGVLINSKNPKDILTEGLIKDNNFLLPINPIFKLDKEYIMSAMGVLSMKNKNLAFKILKENIVDI